jgi:hypothetical protein
MRYYDIEGTINTSQDEQYNNPNIIPCPDFYEKLELFKKNITKEVENKELIQLLYGLKSDYIVVEGTELESFRDDVMKKMAEGYILQGSLSYYEGTKSPYPSRAYRQALVKSNKPLRNLLANNANLLNM